MATWHAIALTYARTRPADNSLTASTAGLFGYRWTSTFDMRLVANSGGTVNHRGG